MATHGERSSRTSKPRWYIPTSGKFIALLLLIVVALYLSDQYDWFAFNKQKGWTVLIAVAGAVAGFVLLGLWAGGTYLFGRKPQFALATLLLLITAAALPCAWLTHAMRQAERQADALAQIKLRGGLAFFEKDSLPFYRVPLSKVDSFGGTPHWLRDVFSDEFFRDVFVVEVYDREHLAAAESLRRLQHISTASEATILDDDLDLLANFPDLESISFDCTEITDTGLRKLQRIRSLKEIVIARSSTTSDGRNRFKQEFAGKCVIRVRRPPGGAIDLSSYLDSPVDPKQVP